MPIKVRVALRDPPDVVEAKILKAVARRLQSVLRKSAPAVRRRLQDLCESLIARTEEYKSLLSGELLGELGIPDVESRLREILDAIRKGVQVDAGPVSVADARLVGSMTMGMLKSDFEDILGLPAASYVSNEKYPIPWLDWLIVEGDRILVFGFDVTFGIDPAAKLRSRTGLALMQVAPGRGWRVPPEHSGTPDSNFLTRAFDVPAVGDAIAEIVRSEIQSRLDRS